MANSRPWNVKLGTLQQIPFVNPSASGDDDSELAQIWAVINELIKRFNELSNPSNPHSPLNKPGGQTGKQGKGGGGTNVLPYDGTHDDVPYVITNGVLKAFPNANFLVQVSGNSAILAEASAATGDSALAIDYTNGIVYPNRIVLPFV